MIAIELDEDIYTILYLYVFGLYSSFSPYALITGATNIYRDITKRTTAR